MGMLYSNTDRSFFMIGAIIVAGLVIGLLVTVIGGDFSNGLSGAVNGLFDTADAVITGGHSNPNGGAGTDEGSPSDPYTVATDSDFNFIPDSFGDMTVGGEKGYFAYVGSDTYVRVPDVIQGVTLTSMRRMFMGTSVEGVAVNNPVITSMYETFKDVTASALDLSSFYTPGVTEISGMFEGLTLTAALDLSQFDTSNVVRMMSMFEGYNGPTVDLTAFDFTSVTHLTDIFKDATTPTILFPSTVAPNQSYYVVGWFQNATIPTLDLTSFDFTNMDSTTFNAFTGATIDAIYVKNASVKTRVMSMHGFPSTTTVTIK